MSFKYLTLVALLASTFSIAQAHAEPANIQADCFYIGGTSLTNDGLISGATQSDAAFNTAMGIITLTPKQNTPNSLPPPQDESTSAESCH